MTYNDLQTAVANWMHRADLASVIPDFIAQGEAMLNRRLRLVAMFERVAVTAPTSTRYLALPNGCLEIIEIKNISTQPVEVLKQCTPGEIASHYQADITTPNRPKLYSIKDQIEFDTISDAAYSLEIAHYRKLDIATEGTNWLLTNYPDAYLYASLAPAADFVGNAQRAAECELKLGRILAEIERQEARKRGAHRIELRADRSLISRYTFDIVGG